MADETHAAVARKKPNYYLVWLYLLILTVVEVGVAFMSGLPETWLILLLLFLAVWKAALFMVGVPLAIGIGVLILVLRRRHAGDDRPAQRNV